MATMLTERRAPSNSDNKGVCCFTASRHSSLVYMYIVPRCCGQQQVDSDLNNQFSTAPMSMLAEETTQGANAAQQMLSVLGSATYT